jgi:hypothetical protein
MSVTQADSELPGHGSSKNQPAESSRRAFFIFHGRKVGILPLCATNRLEQFWMARSAGPERIAWSDLQRQAHSA